MDHNLRRLKASLQLFDKLGCCFSNLNGNFRDVGAALALVDVDKMRCHIINCLTALHLIQTEKESDIRKKNIDESVRDECYELVKGNVFNAAISMISDDTFDSDEAVVGSILLGFPFPDKNEILKNTASSLSTLLSHWVLVIK
jgi:hypothetical protein